MATGLLLLFIWTCAAAYRGLTQRNSTKSPTRRKPDVRSRGYLRRTLPCRKNCCRRAHPNLRGEKDRDHGLCSQGASSSSSNPAARSDGVLEYCAKSELHPRSWLGMLTPGDHL